jgi:hypothetical protein
VEQVLEALDQAAIVIADLTGNNPSVLYELAVCHCMGLPCIHVVDVVARKADDDANLANLARETLKAQILKTPKEEFARLAQALELLDDLTRPLAAFDIGHERYAAIDFEAEIETNPNLVNMLCASIKETEDLSVAARNPITSHYKGTPLTDALGDCLNFLVRTVASVVDRTTIKIHAPANQKGQERFLAPADPNAEFEFENVRVRIRIQIAFVQPGYIGRLKQKGDFCNPSLVHDPTGYRDINLLICPQTCKRRRENPSVKQPDRPVAPE